MFEGHYIEWNKNRINFIFSTLDKKDYENKSVLEVGCGYAKMGESFWEKGCKVHSTDAREKHILVCKDIHSNKDGMSFEVMNLEGEIDSKEYDILLHVGVLYHLPDIEKSIKDMSKLCKETLILETEVCDSDDPDFCLHIKEYNGYDQSISGRGSRPSADYVERLLDENGFSFIRYDDSKLNSVEMDSHFYDWEVKNTNTWENGRRRFWICKKK